MPRKLRLSVYRKNQYKLKKERVEQLKLCIVSIPRDLVTIHPVSLPITAYLDAPLSCLSTLKRRIENKHILAPWPGT